MAKQLKFKPLDRVKKTDTDGYLIVGTVLSVNETSKTPYTIIWDSGVKKDHAQKELRPVDTRRKVIFTIEPTGRYQGAKSYRWKSVKNGRITNHKYNNPGAALKQLQQFISDIKSDNYKIVTPGKK